MFALESVSQSVSESLSLYNLQEIIPGSVPVGEVTEGNAIPGLPLMTRPDQEVGPCSPNTPVWLFRI